MNFSVMLTGEIRVEGQQDQQKIDDLVEGHLDEVMEHLGVLGAGDPSIELDMTEDLVTFGVLVDAANPLEAINQASGILRTSIHHANGATPDWPGADHEAWFVRLVSVRSDPVEALETETERIPQFA